MEISPSAIGAGAAVCALVGGTLVKWVYNEMAERKRTDRALYEKYDDLDKELQDYKLHVAETYVNEAALEKALKSINDALKEIRDDLREARDK